MLGLVIAHLAKPESYSGETIAGADELSQAAEVISPVKSAAKLSGVNTLVAKEHALHTTMLSAREVDTAAVVAMLIDTSAAHAFEKEKHTVVAPAPLSSGYTSISRDRARPSTSVMAYSTQSIPREPLAPVAVLAPNPGSLGLSSDAQETVEALADYFVDAVGEPDLTLPNSDADFMSRVRKAASETDAYIRLHYGHHAYVQLQLQASRQQVRE